VLSVRVIKSFILYFLAIGAIFFVADYYSVYLFWESGATLRIAI
jgi:hypothetical protein